MVFFRNHIFYVKRVVALNGDSIPGKQGMISVNGEEQHEPYLHHVGPQWPDGIDNFGPVPIPSGQCLVMGDNRDISLDSRSPEFGLVENGSIVGKPLHVFGSDRVGGSIQ
jgi:signal peptidase I